MGSRFIFVSGKANSPKVRLIAKIWKFQINFPCGLYLKEDISNAKPVTWNNWQVLN